MPPSTAKLTSRLPRSLRLLLALCAIIPLCIAVPFAWRDAQQTQADTAARAAQAIETSLDVVLQRAHQAVESIGPMAGLPCLELQPDLLRRVAAIPRVRSLAVLDGDKVSCSSTGLPGESALSDITGAPKIPPTQDWTMIAAETPVVPGRPVLVVGHPVSGTSYSVLAFIDDRNLRDLVRASLPLDAFLQVDLNIGQGLTLHENTDLQDLAPSTALLVYHTVLSGDAVTLRIYPNPAYFPQLFYRLLPYALMIALLVCIIVCAAVYGMAKRRYSIRAQLLHAIRKNQFHMEYQPIYEVATHRCAGVEALIRWDRPEGAIGPDEFIGAAERHGAIIDLTRHMMRLVAQDAASWRVAAGFHVSVNVSPQHIAQAHFQADFRQFLANVEPYSPEVWLEITERSMMRESDQTWRLLQMLREQKVRIAIDDFGTGYSALSYLAKLPLDLLKIDRSFVLTIDAPQDSTVTLNAIIQLGHGLDVQLVAEGVDTLTQLDYLTARGVHFIQGYLFSRPLPSAQFADWYAAHGADMSPRSD